MTGPAEKRKDESLRMVERLAHSLNQIYRKMDLFKEELQTSPKEQLFLLNIEEIEPCRLKDLAQRVNLPLSTVSWTADKMVAKGYLKRRQDPSDRRAVMLEVARRGKVALARHHEIFENVARLAVEHLPEKEFKHILSIVEKIEKLTS